MRPSDKKLTAYSFALIAAFFFFFVGSVWGQNKDLQTDFSESLLSENKPETLEAISESIDLYKGSTVAMRLRLKNVDAVFYTITFYDSSNHDVVFDISSKKGWKAFQPMLLNAHGGMFYDVVFKVNGAGNLGLLDCSLLSFQPAVLNLLPENAKAE